MVVCTDPEAPTPAWISDGRLGVRVNRVGQIVGFSRPGAGQPFTKTPFRVTIDGRPLTHDPASRYLQQFDMSSGELTTWVSNSAGVFRSSVWIRRDTAKVMYRLEVKPRKEFELIFDIPPDLRGAGSRWMFGQGCVAEMIRPGLYRASLHPYDFNVRFEGAISAGSKPGPNVEQPLPDIEIDGPVEDQQAVRSFLTYLRMAIPPKETSAAALSPHALSANFYKGHVFWDADVWVFPALVLLDPERARAIPDFRLARFDAAKRNYDSWWTEQKRAGTKQPGAAKYPWESTEQGQEGVTGAFREEVHVNGDVLWGLDIAEKLGLADPKKVSEVEVATKRFWTSLATPRPGGNLFDIKQVFGIDEFRMTDNDLITNILAQWTLNGRTHERPAGVPVIYLPREGGGGETTPGPFLTYEGDRQQTFKQAAAVLSIYPFQHPEAERDAKRMMERYASRIDEHGPAMTGAIHATIFARLGEPEKAYEIWKNDWKAFTGPLLMFSEHRKRDRSYFVTGAAGCLQTVLYGFLGFRIDSKKEPGAWTLPLRGGWLSVKPHLPKSWKRVTVRNLRVLGQNYTLEITHQGVRVTERLHSEGE